ncbi:enoyl-CoA hydratase-related protein [Achromobacter deleyi]|uniref:enoyl-CoA hydratase-related protein n=1 Tax=Achromobacter deleyi TaxID=1353891 RepID=UPI0015817D99|nr:enoyl-CoA hydratase-related protein [Achromobacter deleyi]
MDCAPAFVRRDDDHGVVTLTLSHPDTLNRFSDGSQFLELAGHVRRANADPTTRVLVITGMGKAFCAGGDLRQMARREGFSAGDVAEVQARYRETVHQLPAALAEIDIPTIAAVNGPAYGAGCDLACFCDMRVAAESARFSVSFARLGIVAGDGGAWMLPRLVGRSKAMELAFTAEPIDAQEARRIGLVSEVTSDGALAQRVADLARGIARHPPAALRMHKRLLRDAEQHTLATHLDVVAAFQAIAHASDEHLRAVREVVSALAQAR